MTTLILYGFDDPHAVALVDELQLRDARLRFMIAEGYDAEAAADTRSNRDREPRQRLGTATSSAQSTDRIAVVWCLGAGASIPIAIANQVAAQGTPVVAVTETARIERFDFNAGFIELCFQFPTAAELRARIDAVVARARVEARTVIVHGDLEIDVDNFEVTKDARRIELTYKEYELLKLFASNPGRVFRREDILNRIWGDGYFGGTRTVDVHVRRLRSKLDDVSHTTIETMWRVGYRFSADEARTRSDCGTAP